MYEKGKGGVIVLFRRAERCGQPLLPLPKYQTSNSAGMDIHSDADLELAPMERKLVPTGFHVQIPEGYEGQIRPRSGLAITHGITVVNSPGTIDADYRGEVCVALVNLGTMPYKVERGSRIAQMVVSPVAKALPTETQELSETERGLGGFGHTGMK